MSDDAGPDGFRLEISDAEYALEDLVRLTAYSIDNEPKSPFRMNLRPTFGMHSLPLPARGLFGEKSVRVRVRWCRVVVREAGLRIESDSRYRWELQDGEFAASGATVSGRSKASKWGLGGKAKAAIGVASGGKGGLDLGAQAGHNREDKSNSVQKESVKPRVAVVEHSGGGWRIGDIERGDPLRGGYLEGSYFDKPMEPYPATCIVKLDYGRDKGSLTLTVDVQDGLAVQLPDRDDDAHKEDRNEVIEKMRAKLGAIRVEKALVRRLPAARLTVKLAKVRAND
jgi:hypothetical protein